ncbi:hypothetical protein DCC35_10650 [Mangrovivirga cuniculi]|uniref:Efflux transporter, outer membrane factor (OMF) lipoprotein, NodT family n=1 Tax=Mangrovivirga cuniculi TaxID=2715131 RepID=A0A4D7JJL8_9BACT|nr:hypothetical protein DCC35_10650 [Mangrovivirga cuniculi]
MIRIFLIESCSPKVAKVDLPYDSLENFSVSGDSLQPDRWWTAFNDDTLNILIDSALEDNLSLKSVWYQLIESRASVAVVNAGVLPQIDLQLRSGISRPEPDFVGGENMQLSLGANYELDLWGRIRYSIHAEEYRFKASYYDYKTAAITLSSQITLNWFRLKAWNQQYKLIKNQIATNEKVLSLIRARFVSGQVKGVDILRQKQLIESTKAQKVFIETQIYTLQNQLSVLLGQPPEGTVDSISSSLPELPDLPSTGVPLKLVNRRPDVQSAYFNLQASDRDLAAAISNKYPRLQFSLTAAIRSNTFENLFQNQAVAVTGSLLAPLFYGGRLQAEVDRNEAVRQQQVNNYANVVLTAFQEIENSLISEQKQIENITLVENQIDLLQKTIGQLRYEYLNGSLPYLDVLVAINQEQQLRRDLINARLQLLEIRVGLYRALAGGFETDRESELKEEESL